MKIWKGENEKGEMDIKCKGRKREKGKSGYRLNGNDWEMMSDWIWIIFTI